MAVFFDDGDELEMGDERISAGRFGLGKRAKNWA
jgi:hypothetical protein